MVANAFKQAFVYLLTHYSADIAGNGLHFLWIYSQMDSLGRHKCNPLMFIVLSEHVFRICLDGVCASARDDTIIIIIILGTDT